LRKRHISDRTGCGRHRNRVVGEFSMNCFLGCARMCGVVAGGLAVGFCRLRSRRACNRTDGAYAFCAETNCSDGSSPRAGLIADGAGNLYGTTYSGGNSGCTDNLGCGTAFKITSDSVRIRTLFLWRGKRRRKSLSFRVDRCFQQLVRHHNRRHD